MCGILFVYNRATKFSNADKKQLSQCLSTMIPRGPDMSSEVYINEHAYMGFRRLSIMTRPFADCSRFNMRVGTSFATARFIIILVSATLKLIRVRIVN